MNIQGPFPYTFSGFSNYQEYQNNIDKLINKIERVDKNIRILENRINKLENKQTKTIIQEEPSDMYMI